MILYNGPFLTQILGLKHMFLGLNALILN